MVYGNHRLVNFSENHVKGYDWFDSPNVMGYNPFNHFICSIGKPPDSISHMGM